MLLSERLLNYTRTKNSEKDETTVNDKDDTECATEEADSDGDTNYVPVQHREK